MSLKVNTDRTHPEINRQLFQSQQRHTPSRWQKIASTIGDIVGVVWEDKVKEVVDKVVLIWKKQTWGMVFITGIASFLSLQVTWAAASFLYATNLGSMISKRAQTLLEQERSEKQKWQLA